MQRGLVKKKIPELAIIDELTGIYNRRYLKLRLEEELARADRLKKPLSVILLDLDHFKLINDTLGHSTGDEVIAKFAEWLKRNARKCDIIVRYAGDEFLILMPGTGREGAERVARRLLKRIKGEPFPTSKGNVYLSFSIGIAVYPEDAHNGRELFDMADRALYRAKLSGKCNICEKFELDTEEVYFPSVKAPFLIGREKELGEFRKIIRKVKEGEGKFVFIIGETGVGKTRLANEVIKYAEVENFKILTARCYEETSLFPYYPFRELFKDFIKGGPSNLFNLLKEIESIFESPSPDGERLMKKQWVFKQKVLDEIKNLLYRLSNKFNLFLFLDDLQWADEASLSTLVHLSRFVKTIPIIICSTFREEETNSTLINSIQSIAREGIIKKIYLKRLNKGETSLFVKAVFPNLFDSERIEEEIYQMTEGNPYFIEEVLEYFVEEGIVYKFKGKWRVKEINKFDIPPTLEDVLRRKISKLDEETQNLLQIASVIGRNFSLSILKGITGDDEGYLIEILDRAVKAMLIKEDEDVEEYSFTHPLIKEVFYRDFSLTKRRRYHEKVAQILESNADQMDNIIDKLAYHYGRSLNYEKAFKYNREAGLRAKKIFATKEALEFFEKALEISNRLKNKELIPQLYRDLGDTYLMTGYHEKALGYYKIARRLYKKSGDIKEVAEIERKMGEGFEKLGNWKEALQLYQESLRTFKRVREREGVLKTLINLGSIFWRLGEYKKAKEYLKKALKDAKKLGKPSVIADCYNNLGNVAWSCGKFRESLKLHKLSLKLREKIGDLYGLSKSYNNLGIVCLDMGKYRDALLYHERALNLRRKIGDIFGVAMSYNNIGIAHIRSGEWGKALDYFERSLEIREELGDIQGVAMTYVNLGIIHMNRGEFERAMEFLKKALRLYTVLKDKRGKAIVFNNMGVYFLERREFEKSEKMVRKSIEISSNIEDLWLLGHNYAVLADLYLQKGKLDKVKHYIEKTEETIKLTGDKNIEATLSLLEAHLLKEKGELEEAKESLLKVMKTLKKLNDLLGYARASLLLGEIYLELGDKGKGERYLRKALSIYEKTEAKILKDGVIKLIGKLRKNSI
jgi:diguanylate cyclase (GGDEF)-like protein